jgi:hypothetical protein
MRHFQKHESADHPSDELADKAVSWNNVTINFGYDEVAGPRPRPIFQRTRKFEAIAWHVAIHSKDQKSKSDLSALIDGRNKQISSQKDDIFCFFIESFSSMSHQPTAFVAKLLKHQQFVRCKSFNILSIIRLLFAAKMMTISCYFLLFL